ncbi:MAG: hypothetical protein UHY90_04405 [Treponema sp.]|nr:hypothetical protein [Spirochaetia bacterium]MDD7459835.1 hypothetical protein [Spirochaetales bacterium]MDY5812091.1 hypothetical protein [Treponema sp.]MEE1181474.1 hypothetical protein [Treponema sp.]
MIYYVFFIAAAVNLVAFIGSIVMYTVENIRFNRYKKIESYIRNMEIENLKSTSVAS